MTATQGWYADPTNSAQLRFWNGSAWTEHSRPIERVPPPFVPGATAQASGGDDQPLTVVFASPEAPRTETYAPTSHSAIVDYSSGPPIYGAATAAPRRRNTGAVVGIVAGVVVLLAAGIGIAVLVLQGGDDPASAADESASPSAPTSAPPTENGTAWGDIAGVDVDAVVRPATQPADYALPEGYEARSLEEVGIVYGTPANWVDLTEPYREFNDFGAEDDSPGEVITYVSAWASMGDETWGPDDVTLTHSRLESNADLTFYNSVTLRGFAIWLEGVTWEQSEAYVNASGIPVIKTIGVPDNETYMIEEHVWVVGGGKSVVVVTCNVYGVGHGCAEVDTIVDTIWMEP